MKIDFLVDSLVPGGAERVLVLLADYFETQGHDVTIITFNDIEVWKPSKAIKRVKLFDGRFKNHMFRSIDNIGRYYYKKKNRPNVLISFMTRTNLIGILVAKLYGIKVIASEHNNHLKEIDRLGDFTRKHAYRFANALTVLTAFDEKYYSKRKVNTYVMPNPCTFDIYDEDVRNRKKEILAVGSLNRYHHKGFDNLIPLITPVLKNNPEWKLRIVGGGKEGMALLKGLTKKHQVEDQVIFEGFSSTVSEIMKQSEIYIMPSRFEGLPMVLLEAMSQGMACISYDCVTGPSEIIDHDTNGILVEDQNADAMSKELEKLINNPEKRLSLAKQGIKSLGRYNIDSIYKKYLNIFDNIL
jgi:glycosyltransferase involved in cell wall biosynthesis